MCPEPDFGGAVIVKVLALAGVDEAAELMLTANRSFCGLGSKFVPVIVTVDPAATICGVNDVMLGALDEAVTINDSALLAGPPGAVTVIGPLIAPAGTETTRLVAVAEVMVAFVPLKLTVSCEAVALKLAPEIVTWVPAVPERGVNENTAVWPLVYRVMLLMLPTAS